WHLAVDLHQGDGVAAGGLAAEMEGGDVVLPLPQQRAEASDEAGLVAIGDVEHVRTELRLHVDALDLDDARPAIGEDGAGDRALLTLRHDSEADVAFVGAALLAPCLLYLDPALPGMRRRRNHVHGLQLRLQEAGERRR